MDDDILNKLKTKSTGGFPPIYICSKQSKKQKIDTNKYFTYNQNQNLIHLEDLLKIKKKEIKPFIEL